MQMAEIKSKSVAQIKELLLQMRKEQMNLRFQKSAGQLATPNRWREVRKVIARLQTALTMTNKEGK
jgi:large subunit ribosomal protein L29